MSPATRIRELANIWAERHPELRERLERAIALTGGVERRARGVYGVEGQNATYVVRIRGRKSTCTCPDSHAERASHCKHRLAVALAVKSEAPH